MQEAVRRGMSKFNVATEYDRAFFNALKNTKYDEMQRTSGRAVMIDIEEAMIALVRKKLQLLNPNKFSL